MTSAEYKSMRLALGLTQGQLAERVGVSRMTINRREAGARRFPITREAAMAVQALALSGHGKEEPAAAEQ